MIVISGKGRAFCAGADLTGALPDRAAPPSPEPTFLDLGATVARIVGINRARYLMHTGDLLSAGEAAAIGLVAKVVPDAALQAEVQSLGEKLAGKARSACGAALRAEKLVSAQHMQSYDASEGGKAFAEKRKPEFRGC